MYKLALLATAALTFTAPAFAADTAATAAAATISTTPADSDDISALRVKIAEENKEHAVKIKALHDAMKMKKDATKAEKATQKAAKQGTAKALRAAAPAATPTAAKQ